MRALLFRCALFAALISVAAIPISALAAGSDQNRPLPPGVGPGEGRAHVRFDDSTGPPRPGVSIGAPSQPLVTPKRALAPTRADASASVATGQKGTEVLGFAQSGEVTSGSWAPDLRLDLLTTVAYFGVNVAGDGSLVTNDAGYQGWASSQMTSLLNAAHSSGDRVVLTVKQFDNGTIASITGSESNRQNAVSNIINSLAGRGGDGVNVDFEGTGSSLAPNFTTFIAELQSGLRSRMPQSSFLTVDTYGSSAQGGTPFNIPALRPYVDAFDVMAYDLTSPSAAHAGPVAPLNGWPYTDNSIVNDYLALVPPSQIILGVPYYGYKWSTTSNGPQAPTIGSATADTYSDSLSDFACAQQLSLNFDPTFYEPWATWYSPAGGDPCGGNHGSWRELYYENAQSLGAKYDMVNTRSLLGIGIWALGYDTGHAELWNVISGKFSPALVAVVGTDGNLFAKQNSQDYQRLGGVLIAAPAAVTVPSASGGLNPLFVGVGTDHQLYVRSLAAGWQPLIQGANGCWDNPAAAVTPDGAGGYTLTVACMGGDQGLYSWQAPVTGSSLPSISTGFTSMGGVLLNGPAVASVNGTVTYFVVARNPAQHVYSRTMSTGYAPLPAACIGHVAVASTPSAAYLACHGTNDELFYGVNTGSGWPGFTSAGGRLIDGPGIALSTGALTIYVEGGDGHVYHSVVNLSATASSPYVNDGGLIQHGVGAVGLRSG